MGSGPGDAARKDRERAGEAVCETVRQCQTRRQEEQERNRRTRDEQGKDKEGIATGRIMAICTSPRRGTEKQPVRTGRLVEDWGLEGDAHAGKWHRQVSLLSYEKVQEFRARGAEADFGAFGENLVVSGIDFRVLPVGTRLRCGEAELEVTQIGKECHDRCAIFQRMGDCIMPREGVFARVLRGGTISVGDEMTAETERTSMPFRAYVLTASDAGFRGEREDRSGPEAERILREAGYVIAGRAVLPDDRDALAAKMREICDHGVAVRDGGVSAADGDSGGSGGICTVDLLVTTGGTGFSPRDCTPEATVDVTERPVPGIPEAMRAASMQVTPRAMLSRGTAGIRRGTLIINLPGSPKAVRECLEAVLPALGHGLDVLRGGVRNCGGERTERRDVP